MGLPETIKIVPELQSLLLREAGTSFTPQQVSPNTDGMFAALAIVLPAAHSGSKDRWNRPKQAYLG
jgi:hypothetical protein